MVAGVLVQAAGVVMMGVVAAVVVALIVLATAPTVLAEFQPSALPFPSPLVGPPQSRGGEGRERGLWISALSR